ncbi:DUF6446 family protein [Profundibacterium mesophilum]|uniref:Histidine kinase n=1 Tax=Profundibacterium mesophilum KAUST100406-0324 TaxID=1037889 RepID=A0A921TE21_9RHOB|nr:DUF6446 family protein [Profundibacterium mesophilum]KAF0677398.1 hypothetical protein PMES_00310 [Profundibacterium mesophilum KAUST100406-0324]
MSGKLFAAILAALAIITGVSVYYLQVYGYYDEVTPDPAGLVPDGGANPQLGALRAIDADSSPLRFRACFTIADPDAMIVGAEPYAGAVPLTAPGWFDCFDAADITEALAEGEAQAWLVAKNIEFGVDRIMALYPDGRAYVWHQLNNCGEMAYDGTPVGETCPPRKETE